MKKILLIVTALMLMVSGVAAVSAYEAHLINVKAHVENALTVNTDEVDFGTVFPQEFIKHHRSIVLSESADDELGTASGDLLNVIYQIFAEWKPVGDAQPVNWVEDDAGNRYFQWMGYFLYVGVDPSQDPDPLTGLVLVGAPVAGPPSAQPVLATGTLPDPAGGLGLLGIAIDTPVFAGFYNVLTDPTPKPSGLDAPTWIIPANFPDFDPDGMDFGIDLKIQVIDINRVP